MNLGHARASPLSNHSPSNNFTTHRQNIVKAVIQIRAESAWMKWPLSAYQKHVHSAVELA